MSQNSLIINNGSGAQVRQAINGALDTLATLNSGTVAPANPQPGMMWLDTSVTPNRLKIRNSDNTAWTDIGSIEDAGFESAAELLAKLKTVDGAGSGLDADLLDGAQRTDLVEKTNLLSEITAIDGTGSGLDADLLRGLPADFTASLTGSGYQKLPSGLIIQWGFETSSLDVQPITFPLAFPTTALFVAATKDPTGITTSVGFTYDTVVRNITTTGFEATQSDSIKVNFRWMAIGY